MKKIKNILNKIKNFLFRLIKVLFSIFIKISEFLVNAYYLISFIIYFLVYHLVLTKWKKYRNNDYDEPKLKHYKYQTSIFNLDTIRLIKATKTRFISLVAIVFVGTAFMMGLLSSSPIMQKSVDKYNDQNNLQDIQIYSNYGFCEDDLTALASIEGVEAVQGSKFVDCYGINQDNQKIVVRAQEIDSYINQITLVDGRLPEKDNECLVLDSQYMEDAVFKIGDKVHLVQDSEEDLDEVLSGVDYTIVGSVRTPEYLSEFQSYSTFHNLTLINALFIPNANFISEYYTTAFLTIKDAKALNSFKDEYFKVIDTYIEKVEELAVDQKDVNKNEIIAKAKEKIAEAEAELNATKAEYEAQFADAKKQLEDADIEIQVGKATIEATQKTIEETQAQIDAQKADLDSKSILLDNEIAKLESQYGQSFDDLYAEVSALYSLYYSMDGFYDGSYNAELASEVQTKLAECNAILAPYETSEAEIKDQMKQISQQMNEAELDESLSEEDLSAKLAELQTAYDDCLNRLYEVYNEELKYGVERDAYQVQLDVLNGVDRETIQSIISQIRSTLDETAGGSVSDSYNGLLQLKTYLIQVEQGYQTIATMQATVDASASQIDSYKSQIKSGQSQYDSALKEYNKSYDEYLEEIEDAETEIKLAEQDLYDLSEGEWTILDRDSHYSSALYKGNSNQMGNIGIAFPILFFLVAALVCMTTMSRLIDEQRGQIGCLVALGYSKGKIISKYVIYAGLAAFAGAVPGLFFGVISFPIVIYYAWGMLYRNPPIQLYMPLIPTLVSFFSFIVLMCVVTYFVARSALKEIPAQLMRPKAPKNMRKTFLEKIGFIWNHLSFTSKITARNIIRYKQRFFMTVIGVAGCCGLLLIGFGITDSISSIVNEQYGTFFKMTHQVTFENYEDADDIETYVEKNFAASNLSKFMSYKSLIKKGTDEATATMVVSDKNNLSNYLCLTNFDTGEPIEFSDTGVVVTKKFAMNNNIKVGDIIKVESKDGLKKEVHVEAIATMYYDHYIYMTNTLYKDLFGATVHPNSISFITEYDADEVSNELLALDSVETVVNVNELTSSFNSMIESLDLITIVIILAAGFLALIVLINLTEVNISERRREIATLKVLGFRPGEVRSYIYKELIILTLIGSIVGIPLGNVGLKFIMDVLNIDVVYFPQVIKPMSYIYAIAMTYGFLAIILYVEKKPLQELEMIESLKSVE